MPHNPLRCPYGGQWVSVHDRGNPFVDKERKDAFSAAKRQVFLDHLASCCTVKTAAAAAGVSVNTVNNHRRNDPVFDQKIGVDPPASAEGDACGIVACALGRDGIGYVLGDHSVRGLSPEGWAAKVADAAAAWGADCVIVEKNQGGDMVKSVLKAADLALPVRPAHARFGKGDRAEPVAMLFETGAAKLAGSFPALEDELCALTRGGAYAGPGRSPDRADAMVWAMTELLLGLPREPRLVRL